jgi:hypothetical protein
MDRFYREKNWSEEFVVKGSGYTGVLTKLNGVSNFRETEFWVYNGAELEGEEMPKRDWLGAIAESAKALPGGGILLGPLIKLRNDEKAAERNAALDEVLNSNKTVTSETLKQVLQLQGSVGEIEMTVDALLSTLTELRTSGRMSIPNQEVEAVLRRGEGVSKFPIPIRPGLLIEELSNLFPSDDIGQLRLCLKTNDFDLGSVGQEEYVYRFVGRLTGAAPAALKRIFACLSKTKPDSKILQFACEYLNASGDAAVV